MAVTNQFTLPDVGEGLTEAEIVTWRVRPGDTVAVNDLLVEVETAKSVVELPSPFAGVIAELHAAEGDTVEVGSVIVTYGGGTGPAEQEQPAMAGLDTAPGEPPEDDDERRPVLVGYGPSRAKVARGARRPGWTTPVPHLDQPVPAPDSRPGAVYATPPVRFRARQLGIDLSAVTPTGIGGRITHRDLESTATTDHPATGIPAETRTPIKGVRKATATAMVASAFTAPHVTEWVTIDVTETLTLVEQLRTARDYAGLRMTPLVLIARATLSALRAHPDMNAQWDDAAGEIVRYRDVNLGIAAATPRGLIVPNIKAAQDLSTRDLCERLNDLVTTARDGRTQPDAMARGTFTITNIGVFAVDGGTPILNPGEAGILCVGRITKRPWEYRGQIALRSVCTLSLSFDHRLVDGQLGSEVLSHVARILEQPALALVQ